MKAVRITAALKQHGTTQFLAGRTVSLPDHLADAFVADGDAEHVPQAEYTQIRRSYETTVLMPKPKKGKR